MKLIIEDLLRDLKPGQTIDFVTNVTRPLASRFLLGEFLRIPPEDHRIMLDYVASWSLLDEMKPGDSKPKAYMDAWNAGVEYCKVQVSRARVVQPNTVVADVAAAYESGALTDGELMAMMVLLYVSGITSIPAAAGACLLNIARHPGLAQRVNSDPALAVKVLDESLRLDAPVLNVLRFAKENVSVDGVGIPEGMPVYIMVAAACHDPAVWPDPGKFDIERPNLGNHIAFGFGMHTCMGNAITRAIVPLFVTEVTRRFPNLRLADPARVSWVTTPRTRDVDTLELTL